MSATHATNVVFVRHGESTLHVGGNLFCGDLDPTLSPLGLAQAEAARATLERVAPRVDRVFVSPRRRTMLTAEVLLPGRDVEVVEELRELSFGRWEGMTKEQARLLTPEAYDAWDEDSYLNGPPDGESGADARPRLEAVVDRLGRCAGETVLVVSHTTFLRLLLALVLETPLGVARKRLEIGFASVGLLDLVDRAAKLRGFNL
jgi:ribonuclease H / adenosylcobalamin/alpha-ribazole phosphatase